MNSPMLEPDLKSKTMKTIDLRLEPIELKEGERVYIVTSKRTYECVAVNMKDDTSCKGCVFESLEGCHRVACSNTQRKDGKNIIIKNVLS